MSAQVAENRVAYDVIRTSEMSHYMTLEEMHERLTNNIHKVLEYIESIKVRPLHPQTTMEELNRNGMPLHQAMDQLREKARAYYQA